MHALARSLSIALALTLLAPAAAHATDTWSTPFPGYDAISRLHRSIPGQEIHAVFVDLSRDDLHIRATRPGEGPRTVTSYANLVGASVAINGDWFDSNGPVGLAVGDGQHYEGSADINWSFIACTVENTCEIDTSGMDRQLDWRWRDVVGGNGAILAVDGQPWHYPDAFYSVDRHPRSAVGVSADGKNLVFVVVEGRRAGANGMTFNEVADLMVEFGAWDAMMLDGGGSSSLVVGGTRINNLPAGASERSVGNHIGIIWEPNANPGCQVANGRWCDGTLINTCQGNANLETGDCAAFGSSCSVTDGIGHCVHPFCPAGGNGTSCLDDTRIATCELGRIVGEGDCAAFGASCESDAQGAYCVHYMCSQGGNATWCDGNVAKTCVRGEFSEVTCGSGQVCGDGECVSDTPPPLDDPPNSDAGSDATMAADTASPSTADASDPATDASAPGTLPDATVGGTLGDAARLDGTTSAPGSDAAATGGDVSGNDLPPADGACACRIARSGSESAPSGGWLAGLGLLGWVWRRRRAAVRG